MIELVTCEEVKEDTYIKEIIDIVYNDTLLVTSLVGIIVTFILISILTSINLANENITIIIGFYFTINGLLEMFDPIAKTLIKHG
jgi:hypothetical protein